VSGRPPASRALWCSGSPFDLPPAERRANLLRFGHSGRPWLDPALPEMRPVLDELIEAGARDLAEAHRSNPRLRTITDDNMLTEFKRIHSKDLIGKLYGIYAPERRWRW
jgi:hypothetical protein